MSRILLDTSAYSAFKKDSAEVIAAIREADEIYITAVVMGELLAGFSRGSRRQKNESEFAQFLESPRVNLIEVDEDTATRYAVIFGQLREAGTMIPTNDVWIAASAMQHGLGLVTLDAHFRRIPQILTHFVAA